MIKKLLPASILLIFLLPTSVLGQDPAIYTIDPILIPTYTIVDPALTTTVTSTPVYTVDPAIIEPIIVTEPTIVTPIITDPVDPSANNPEGTNTTPLPPPNEPTPTITPIDPAPTTDTTTTRDPINTGSTTTTTADPRPSNNVPEPTNNLETPTSDVPTSITPILPREIIPLRPEINRTPDIPEEEVVPEEPAECPPINPLIREPIECPKSEPLPIIPQTPYLLFLTPFLALGVFWGILSLLNHQTQRTERQMMALRSSNQRRKIVQKHKAVAYQSFLDFISNSLDEKRPFNEEAFHLLLAKNEILGSSEMTVLGQKIKSSLDQGNRSQIKPLMKELAAQIKKEL